MHKISVIICTMLVAGCSVISDSISGISIPSTPGEWVAGASYVPIDPLRVPKSCQTEPGKLLKNLPDHVSRLAIGEYNEEGEISYGPGQIGHENKIYKVILDYVNTDTTSVDFRIFRFDPDSGKVSDPRKRTEAKPGTYLLAELTDPPEGTSSWLETLSAQFYIDYNAGIINGSDSNDTPKKTRTLKKDRSKGRPVTIPVYVGIGLRLTATVRVLKGKVGLGSLSALALAAQAGQISGSLVIQTLGISGSQVSTILPLPNQIDQPTIQDAILNIGSIKALLYESTTDNRIILRPRVTGFFNPYAGSGPELISSIISELARSPASLELTCPS